MTKEPSDNVKLFLRVMDRLGETSASEEALKLELWILQLHVMFLADEPDVEAIAETIREIEASISCMEELEIRDMRVRNATEKVFKEFGIEL